MLFAVLTLLLFYMHRENIKRLVAGTESKIGAILQRRFLRRRRVHGANSGQKVIGFRKTLAANPQYKKTRYLDPANTSGSRKDFYNPNIVAEFDKAYTKKK